MRWGNFGLVVGLLIAAGGSGLPQEVAGRPVVASCNEPGDDIYLPATQGPVEAQAASQAAIDCILASYDSVTAREADFVLLGTEGAKFRTIVQTLADGTVNLYWGTSGWDIYEGCDTLNYDGVFFSVDDCTISPPTESDE